MSLITHFASSTGASSKFQKLENVLGDGYRPYKWRASFTLPAKLSAVQSLINQEMILITDFSLPEQTLIEIPVSVLGRQVNVPLWQKTDNETSVTFYIDNSLVCRNLFDLWIRCIDKTLSDADEKEGGAIGNLVSAATKFIGMSDNFGNEDAVESRFDTAGMLMRGLTNLASNLLGLTGSSTNTTTDFLGKLVIYPLDYLNLRMGVYAFQNLYPKRIDSIQLTNQDNQTLATVRVTFGYTHYQRGNISLADSAIDIASDALSGEI